MKIKFPRTASLSLQCPICPMTSVPMSKDATRFLVNPSFGHKCCKNHTRLIIVSRTYVSHNFLGLEIKSQISIKFCSTPPKRRHAEPFWARRRRLTKNKPACITGLTFLSGVADSVRKLDGKVSRDNYQDRACQAACCD